MVNQQLRVCGLDNPESPDYVSAVRWSGLCLVLPAVLAIPAAAAPPRQAPYFSAREAPPTLVYRIFFRECVAPQRAADEAAAQGKDGAGLRTLFQRTMGFNDYEHQVLAAAAQTCVTELERNERATQRLVEELKKSAGQAAVRAKLAEWKAASEAAVTSGVQQLRERLPAERFARMNRFIRVHVTQNLRLVPGRGGAVAGAGGN